MNLKAIAILSIVEYANDRIAKSTLTASPLLLDNAPCGFVRLAAIFLRCGRCADGPYCMQEAAAVLMIVWS